MTTEETDVTTVDNRYTRARELVADEFAHMDLEPEYVTVYTLLAITYGEDTTDEHVHDAWGVVRCVSKPDHHDLIPFDHLPERTQRYDREFRDGVRRVAAKLGQVQW